MYVSLCLLLSPLFIFIAKMMNLNFLCENDFIEGVKVKDFITKIQLNFNKRKVLKFT